ncbi:MAG: hypothetical protein ACI4TK_19625 [Agathobacter sp.]
MPEEFNNNGEQTPEEETQNNYGDYSQVNPTPQPMTEAVSSNLIPGLVGAFLGSLIGAVLWVVIYKIGFIAGIAGAVIAVCAMKGYEMLGKSLDKKGVICSLLIVIVTIFLANKISWSWEIFEVYTKEFGYDMTFFDAFVSADEIIEFSELTVDYYKDLAIGYVLTALSCYKNFITAFKSAK